MEKEIRKEAAKHKRRRVILLLLILITVCFFVYSPWASALSAYRQAVVISGYTGDYNGLKETDENQLKEEAARYNAQIFTDQQSSPFYYQGESYEDPLYDEILKVSPFSSVMAYVEIPKTKVYLPVVHGTRSEDLTYQAGHLHGTSVPIGGKNTHCVISAHTGLKSATLFTGIDRLEAGDEIRIHVLNEVLLYTVTEKQIVLPQEADACLQIEAGKDLLTLYTCTPYGINSHRLLVKCEHTGNRMAIKQQGQMQTEIRNYQALFFCILWSLVPLVLLAAGSWFIFSKKGGRLLDRFFHVAYEETRPSGKKTEVG